jgi:hypothetical protein
MTMADIGARTGAFAARLQRRVGLAVLAVLAPERSAAMQAQIRTTRHPRSSTVTLIRPATPATLYVYGGADNELELAGRFTQVFLLEIDEPTTLARLDARRDYTTGAVSGTLASTCAASCRDCRTACVHPGRSP